MTIRHLKIFIKVAECGKMNLAAEKLFISQPSVSQAIRELEDHYGVKLFERLNKKLFITDSGKELLNYGRHIIQSYDEMEIKVRGTGGLICLRIGATLTVGTCLLQPFVDTFEEDYENVTTKVFIHNTHFIEQMLLQSQLDIGIVEGKILNKDLLRHDIYEDKLVLVVGKKHKLYNQESIGIKELEGYALIGREEGSAGRNLFEEVLKKYDVHMPVKWECTGTDAIRRAAIGGEGIAVLSELMVKEEIENATLHTLQLEGVELTRKIGMVWHKDKFMSDALKGFFKTVEKCLDEADIKRFDNN